MFAAGAVSLSPTSVLIGVDGPRHVRIRVTAPETSGLAFDLQVVERHAEGDGERLAPPETAAFLLLPPQLSLAPGGSADITVRWVGARHLDAADLAAHPRLSPVRIRRGAELEAQQFLPASYFNEKAETVRDEIRTGVEVDAAVTKHLIENIFYDKAPLHDGAMVIRDGRIHACGCFLPLSGNPNLPVELGTRHRAGLGVSEISDAFVIIVSEETGKITVAKNGEFDRNVDPRVLRHRLINEFGLNREKKKGLIKRKGGEKE